MKDIKEIEELKVYRDSTFVGVLRRTPSGAELEYSNEFLKSREFNELTYRTPKSPEPIKYNGVNLPPFFAGLLPEGLRFKAMVNQLKTSEDDLFSLLVASGEQTVGDVYTISDEIERTELSPAKLKQVDFYDLFQSGLDSSVQILGEDPVAGVQEKISASMISFPVSVAKEDKSYILKLNPKDKPNLVENEYRCLQLAKKCGFKVNAARVVKDRNGNTGLLVERFDRKSGTKIHQEDACQFLDRYPADKYRLSFQDVCSGIQELSTAPALELLEVIKLYVFSYLIGNGDLHAKNISLQTDPDSGRVQLTPCYDLICTYLYGDQSMALKLDGRDRNFKMRYFVDFAARFGIGSKAIESSIEKLLCLVEKHEDLLFEIPDFKDKSRNPILERWKL